MLILAIDSATPVAGVALLDGDKLLSERYINYKKTHSETLMPMVNQVLQECDKNIKEVEVIAVTIGPGSFTGLRIGLAAVKGLSMANRTPVVAVSSLDVIAHNIVYNKHLIAPLLDARRQEVYTAFYTGAQGYPQPLSAEIACSPEKFVEKAQQIIDRDNFEHIILLGDGYLPYKDYFYDAFKEKMLIAPPHCMYIRAASLAGLAKRKAESGDFADISNLKPVYLRLSEAEYRLGKGEL
jgi:tRNA threonylcarbamoyladenosine biosynthesis protein TsaB